MASKREISFLITGDARKLAAEAAKAESELQKLDNFKLKAKDLGVSYDSKQIQEQLARLNDLKIATKYARVEADVKTAEQQLAQFQAASDERLKKLETIRMTIDSRMLGQQLAEAEEQLKKLGTEAQQAFQARMTKLGQSLTHIGTIMDAAVTAPIVAGFGLAIKSSSDLGEALDYTNRLMGEGAEKVHAFGEMAAQSHGLSRVEVEKYAQAYATMLKGAGLNMEEVTNKSIELVKRTADIGSALNMTAGEVAAKLQSGLAGETEALRTIGVIIDEDIKKRYAWTNGLVAQGKELNAQEKLLASFGLIMDKTTDQANNFGDTVGISLPNQMKAAKAESQNTAASFGTILKPILTDVMGVANKFVVGFSQIPPEMQKTIIVAGGLFAAMGPLLTIGGQLATNWQKLSQVTMVFRNHIKDVETGANVATGGLNTLGKAALGLTAAFVAFEGIKSTFKAIEEAKIEYNVKLLQQLFSMDPSKAAEAEEKFSVLLSKIKMDVDSLPEAFGKSGVKVQNAWKYFSPTELGKEIKDVFGKNGAQKSIEDLEAAFQELYKSGGISMAHDALRKVNEAGTATPEIIDRLTEKIGEWEEATIRQEIAQEKSAKQHELTKQKIIEEQAALQANKITANDNLGVWDSLARGRAEIVTKLTASSTALKVEAEALTANERARYRGRDADEAAIAKAMPKARAWVQEQLDADKKVAEAREALRATKETENAKIEAAEEKLKETRKAAFDMVKEASKNEARIIEENAEKVKEARNRVAEVEENAAKKMTEAARRVEQVIIQQNRNVEEASDRLFELIVKGREKVDEAKADVQEAMAERDAAILKAAQEYQRQLEVNNENIAKSEQNLARVVQDTERDMADAQNDLSDAIRDAKQDEIDAIRDFEEASRDANQSVQDAMRDVAETAIDTARDIEDAETDLARAIEDASERIEDAKRAAAEAAEDMAERVLAAEERLSNDKKDYAKDISDAEKESAKTQAEGRKDVAKAEADLAKALAKSGAGSEDARSAAERLQEVRERAAENNAKALERIAELQEKAARRETENTRDLEKAKDALADKEIENADKIADAEREAARDVEDAVKEKDRAIQDGARKNAEAAEQLAQAQIEALGKIAEAQANLDRVRAKGIEDVQDKQLALDRVNADSERDRLQAIADLRDAHAEAERLRKEKSDEGAKIVMENDKKVQDAKDNLSKAEKAWQDSLREGEKNLSKAIEDRKREFAEANKLITETEAQNVKDIEEAHKNLRKTIKQTELDNQTAIDATAKAATTAAGNIKREMDAVDEARKNAATTVKNAENDVTTALNDQKTKWGELKTEFSTFDVATQKAIRSQISLIKGGSLPDGDPVPNGGLEQAMKDLIGEDGGSSGVKGLIGAIQNLKTDIENLPKTIDIKVNYTSSGGAPNPSQTQYGNPDGTPLPYKIGTPENPYVVPAGEQVKPSLPGKVKGEIETINGWIWTWTGDDWVITGQAEIHSAPAQGVASGIMGGVGGAASSSSNAVQAGSVNASVGSPPASAQAQTTPAHNSGGSGGGATTPTTPPRPSAPSASVATAAASSSTKLSDKAKRLWGAGNATLKPPVIKFLNVLAEQSILVGYISDIDGWGTRDNPTMHDDGLALDIFLKVPATANRRSPGGDSVAAWCVANRSTFGINAVIFNKVIWHRNGSSDPYVGTFSNGKPKSPHYDHVHVEWSSGGADIDEEFASSIVKTGGIQTNAAMFGVTPSHMSPDTASTTASGGMASSSVTGTYGASSHGGISASVSTYVGSSSSVGATVTGGVGAVATEAEVNRRRQEGLLIEERIQRRRAEMLKLEELALALKEREKAVAEGITSETEMQRINANVATAASAASAATEQRIAADRRAGADIERYSVTARKTGAQVEEEIKNRRMETEQLTGQAAAAAAASMIGASVAASGTTVEASSVAGENIVNASNVAGQAIVGAANGLGTAVTGAANVVAQSMYVITAEMDAIAHGTPEVHDYKRGAIDNTVAHGGFPIPTVGKVDYTAGSFAAKRLIDPRTNTVGAPTVEVAIPGGGTVTVSPSQAQWISWWIRWNAQLVAKGYPSQAMTTTPPSWWTGPNHPLDDETGAVGSSSGSGRTDDGTGGGGSSSRDNGYPGFDGSSGGSGSGGSSSNEPRDIYHIEAPLIIQIDGKEVARATYTYTKQIARQNGDILADGSWRIDNRR